MSTHDTDHAADGVREGRTGCLEWMALIVLVVVVGGYFVVWPIAQRAVEGFGAAAESALQGALEGLSQAVVAQYDEARLRVEHSPRCHALFGEPITCPPPDEATWLEGSGDDTFEFTFAIEGPKGRGSAHAYVAAAATGLEIERLEVTAPDGEAFDLPNP